MHQNRALFFISSLVAIMVLLAACGNAANTEPTPEPTPGPPTAAPDQMTVAELTALSDDAWADITFMRTTSQSGSVPGDGESEEFSGTVQDWTPDGDRHVLEFVNGSMVNEQLWVDGTVYMRGQFVSSAVAPELDVDTWVILDADMVPENTPVGVQIQYLTRDQHGPYGELTEDILVRPVQEAGTATVGERTCTVYTFGDENETGTEIRYEIAVDESGLPCQVIQRAGDFQNSTVYVFDLDVEIEAPIEGTPVSGTPEG